MSTRKQGEGTTAGVEPPGGDGGPRRRILDAALDIVETEGIAALTQPKVAKAAGLRQSHLTYYFPRKADLVIALLEASHGRAERRPDRSSGDVFALLAGLMFERERMVFFLGILMAVSDDPELRDNFRAHADGLAAEIAGDFGVAPDDPALAAFIDELRGAGLRRLIVGDSPVPDIAAMAARHGLRTVRAARPLGRGASRAKKR